MRELNPEIADVPREHLLIKIFRIFGVILSLLVLFLICLWTIKWYDREINDLPVIAALQGEIRIKPEDIKGEEILNKGFSVNTVLENSSGDTGDRKISLAPFTPTSSTTETIACGGVFVFFSFASSSPRATSDKLTCSSSSSSMSTRTDWPALMIVPQNSNCSDVAMMMSSLC